MHVLLIPRAVVQAAQQAAATQTSAPAAGVQHSAAEDFVNRAQGKLQSGWRAEWADAPRMLTFRDLNPAVQTAVKSGMKAALPSDSPAYRAIVRLATHEGFIGLDENTQLQMLAQVQSRPGDRQFHRDLRDLAASRQFQRIDPGVRQDVVAGFSDPMAGDSQRADYLKFLKRAGLAKLDPQVRDQIAFGYGKNLLDPSFADKALARTRDPDFQKLSPEVQAGYFRALGHNNSPVLMADEEAAQERVTKLFDSPEFEKLDAISQKRWMDGLAHDDPAIRKQSHERLEATWNNPYFTGGDEELRGELMRRAAGALHMPGTVREDRDPLPGASAKKPVITRDKSVTSSDVFLGGKKVPAEKYDVKIDGRTIEVFIPKNRDPAQGHFHTVDQIAASLAGMPKDLRRHVQQVIVEPARIGGEGGPYMLAGQAHGKDKNRVFISPTDSLPDRVSMTATLTHETGHLIAGGVWVKDRARADEWKAGMYADDKWPSFYAATSLQEDVAETVQLYYQVKGTAAEEQMKKDFPNRYRLVKDLLGEK